MKKMKAVRFHDYGGGDVLVLEEIPRPAIGDDEVLVKVAAAGVNPVDWKVRGGYLKDFMPYDLPLIPGWDFSGVVEETGSGVSGLAAGEEVYGLADLARDGTYAEYVAVKAATVAPKPKSIDHLQAASVPLAGLTAWQALFDIGGLDEGQRILVHAAAGGVGIFAVQFARWKGAYVIGTASARNKDFLISLGVDEVVDYTAAPFEEAVQDVDLVLDAMGGEVQSRSWAVLKKGGILVSLVGPPDETAAADHGVRGEGVFVQPNAGQLSRIGELIDSGAVTTCIAEVLPLSEARKAQELNETGHTRGKIVLEIAG